MSLLLRNKGAMILLMVNMFLAMSAFGLVVPVMPEYIRMLGLNGTTAGLLTAAFAVTQLFFSPIAGRISDNFGRKKTIVLGVAILALSELIFALANSAVWLFLSRLLGGSGLAFVMPSAMAYAADITSEQERAKGMSYVSAALSTGFLVGPAIGGFLAEFGTRIPFYVAAIGAGIAAIITGFVLPEVKRAKEDMEEVKANGIFKDILGSVKTPFFSTLIVLMVLGFSLANFETVFGLYLDAKFSFGPKDIAVIMTIGAIAGVIVQLGVLDLLVKKMGELKVIYLNVLIASLAVMAILLTNSYWSLVLVTIIIFAACDILRPAASTYLSKQAGNDQGYVAGLNSSYNSIGTILGSSIAGMLYDVNINVPYLVAGITLLTCYLFLYLKTRNNNHEVKKMKVRNN